MDELTCDLTLKLTVVLANANGDTAFQWGFYCDSD